MSTSKNSHLPQVKIQDTTAISSLVYPHDVGKYYISFSFAEYGPQYSGALGAAADAIGNLTGGETIYNGLAGGVNFLLNTEIRYLEDFRKLSTQYAVGNINGQIILPVPVNLLDDQQLDYNAFNMINAVTSIGAQAIGPKANVVESVYNFGSVATGLAVNPFMALMFNGPKFKTHQFGWRFSPKTIEETKSITDIFTLLKKKSLPKFASGAVFVYPDVVGITLHPANARNNMYTFKPAVITQVSIHHAPSGTPSFFAGSNAPVEIELKLQLTELSIWTQEDFPNAPK